MPGFCCPPQMEMEARRQLWGCSWWEQKGRRTEGTPGKGVDPGSLRHNQLCLSKGVDIELLLDRGCWGTPGLCAVLAPPGFYEEVDFTSALLRGARCQPGREFPSGLERDDRQQLHGLVGWYASLGASGPLGARSGDSGPGGAGCRQRQGEGGTGSPASREQKWLCWVSATGRVFRKSGFVVEDKHEPRSLPSILGSAADLLWPRYLPFLNLIILVKRVTQILIAQIPSSLSVRAGGRFQAATSGEPGCPTGAPLFHLCLLTRGFGPGALPFSSRERNLKEKHPH